ncbi:MAG: GlgB N-terminal domain-containing protein, partial [Rhizobiaceae bacterium]
MPLPSDDARRILEGMHHAAHAVLGMHKSGGTVEVVCRIANAEKVEVVDQKTGRSISRLEPLDGSVFAGTMPRRKKCFPYKLRASKQGHVWEFQDPYAFGPIIGEVDQHLFNEGRHQRLWQMLGAHVMVHGGVAGTHFAVWAPNASSVAIVGDFNAWDGDAHIMRPVAQTGVWELFLPGIGEGETYKYKITDRHGKPLPLKADPVGFGSEHAPNNASIVRRLDGFEWHDSNWMSSRQKTASIDRPVSIYEVHLGSWRTVPEENNRPLSYLEHAAQLVDYAKNMGFTHIELMPISEFPFDGSWGYQPIGLFSPTIRYGTLNEFRDFVQACHQADLGLILD